MFLQPPKIEDSYGREIGRASAAQVAANLLPLIISGLVRMILAWRRIRLRWAEEVSPSYTPADPLSFVSKPREICYNGRNVGPCAWVLEAGFRQQVRASATWVSIAAIFKFFMKVLAASKEAVVNILVADLLVLRISCQE